jgi:Recombination endonuclease VII
VPYLWTEERVAYWDKTLKYYGWSCEELSAKRKDLLVWQKFLCAICGRWMGGGRIAYLDHDHSTGAIRGMLCMTCNRFRVAKNSYESSQRVVQYLLNPPFEAFKAGVQSGSKDHSMGLQTDIDTHSNPIQTEV